MSCFIEFKIIDMIKAVNKINRINLLSGSQRNFSAALSGKIFFLTAEVRKESAKYRKEKIINQFNILSRKLIEHEALFLTHFSLLTSHRSLLHAKKILISADQGWSEDYCFI